MDSTASLPRTIACEDIAQSGDFRHLRTIAGIDIDLRYQSANNFVGRDLYSPLDCAWLHHEGAAALERAVAWLAREHAGLTLLVLDALRPQRVQQALWDSLAGTDLRMYLANPERGSIHSFGMAIDITLRDSAGHELDMGTPFDDLTALSHPKLEAKHLAEGALTSAHIAHRTILRTAMQHAGFQGISTEWWHFDCGDRDRVRREFKRVL
jgi:zinc D-Ala-D-Ala dipeptidase